jgi:hypothetical protein
VLEDQIEAVVPSGVGKEVFVEGVNKEQDEEELEDLEHSPRDHSNQA